MSVIGVATVVLALAYLAATLIFQFRPLSSRFPGLDRLGLLPRWKFFTQGNASYDVGVDVQDRRADGSLTSWSPIVFAPPRRLLNSLWFPDQYRAGMLWLAIDRLERRARLKGDAAPETSLAYTMILNHCRSAPTGSDPLEARRFALMRARNGRGGVERWVVFTSDFHTL